LFKFWTLCVFEPPFGGLGTTYDVHLGLIGNIHTDIILIARLRLHSMQSVKKQPIELMQHIVWTIFVIFVINYRLNMTLTL